MNELKENKGAGLKYFLFIGIPVIIVLGILGAYYYATNPMNVLIKTINKTHESLNNLINDEESKNQAKISGNISFKTNQNWNGLEELQNYDYDFLLAIDKDKKQLKMGLGMNKDQSTILNFFLYMLNGKQYLESTKVYEKILELPETQTLQTDVYQSKYNSADLKTIIRKCKDYLVESLNKDYIHREKTDININNETIKTTKITYLLDKENQKRTLKYLENKILADDELLTILSNIQEKDKNTIKDEIQETFNNYTYTDDYKINLFTESLKQNVIHITVVKDKENIISITNYNNEKSINFEDELEIHLVNQTDKELELNYLFKNEKITGKIKIEKENQKRNIIFRMNQNANEIEFNITYEIKYDTSIDIPNITNSKKIDELSGEETLEIFNKLENILKDTIFYKLIEKNIL